MNKERIWDVFDDIRCIHYLPYKNRLPKMRSELDRVGILCHPSFRWKLTYDSPFYEHLYKRIKHADIKGDVPVFKASLAHYECIKEAYELGKEHVLIMENDIVFLKDVDRIAAIVSKMPMDYDIVLFDKFLHLDNSVYQDWVNHWSINDEYARFSHLWSVGCYALTRRGMEHFITNQERMFNVSDWYVGYKEDALEDKELRRAFSITNVCVQNFSYKDCLNAKLFGENVIVDTYRKTGVDFSLYNLDD